tara:strand:+ start:279 stop:611 length:333 start_codon:yes stop_codon:yes gene_type:complete
MTKQSMTINGKTFTWDVPVKVVKKKKRKKWKKKKKKRQKRENPNLFRTVSEANFVRLVEECPTKDFTNFLEECPYFSLDTPVIIGNKELFAQQYEKDLKQMIKALGHIEM